MTSGISTEHMAYNWRNWLREGGREFSSRVASLYTEIRDSGDCNRYKLVNKLSAKLFQLDQLVKAYQKAGGKVDGKGGVAELLRIRPNTVYQRIGLLGLFAEDLHKDCNFFDLVEKSTQICQLLDNLLEGDQSERVSSQLKVQECAWPHRVVNHQVDDPLLDRDCVISTILNSLKGFSDRLYSVAKEAGRETDADRRLRAFRIVIEEMHSEIRYRFSRELFRASIRSSSELITLSVVLRDVEFTLKKLRDQLRLNSANTTSVLSELSSVLEVSANRLISACDQFATHVLDSYGIAICSDEQRDPLEFWKNAAELLDQIIESANMLAKDGWKSSSGAAAKDQIWRLCEVFQDEQMRCGSLDTNLFKNGIGLLDKFVHILKPILDDPTLGIPEDDWKKIEGVMTRSIDRSNDLSLLERRVARYMNQSQPA